MAEHWIPIGKALELAGNEATLFSRLRAGLAVGRAEVLVNDGGKCENCLIPTEVWASAEEYTVQDSIAGDLLGVANQSRCFQAFGVTIALTGVLGMFEFHQRAAVDRALSVASDPDWIPACSVNDIAQAKMSKHTFDVGAAIIEQARLGFITAKAVLAQAKLYANSGWRWEEREWNIPGWFWTDFTIAPRDMTSTMKQLSANGSGPSGDRLITLHGLHFCRKSLEAVPELEPALNAKEASARGRPPKTAHILSCGRTTIYLMISDGRLKAFKLGRRTLIKAESIRSLITGQEALA